MEKVSQEELRKAIGRFAAGVTVVATLKDRGKVHGMTANAVASVCLTLPLILVCIGHQRNTYRYIRRNGNFSINVLGRDQTDVAAYCASDERVSGGDAPAIYDSLSVGLRVSGVSSAL